MTSLGFPQIICIIISFIPAIVFHEVMHGFAANRLGDPTAKRQGRLSLNPLKHIDPFGTVILPLLLMFMGAPVFGYAKPVPYNPAYFKDPRKGDLIVGLAGPFANLVMAIAAVVLAWAFLPLAQGMTTADVGSFFYYFYMVFLPYFAIINLNFMFFNLLPIPPLDGSSIFAILIPKRYLPKYYKIQRYALPIFFVVIIGIPYLSQMLFGVYFNPVGLYLEATTYNLINLLFP